MNHKLKISHYKILIKMIINKIFKFPKNKLIKVLFLIKSKNKNMRNKSHKKIK